MAVWLVALTGWAAGGRVLYETQFERAQGFDPELTLIGQDGWVGEGSGGNGLIDGFFPGLGQHAFIGFTAPTNSGEFLNAWRPVNYLPGPTNPPVVRISVQMSIEDSSPTVTDRDDFRWSVYNREGNRLFTLDFENETLGINYLLNGETFVPTGRTFTNAVLYQLEMWIDFERNEWSASLDGVPLVSTQPVTTQSYPLNFGDVDAVWAIRTPGKPGDNFMVFDNLRIVAESPEPNPPSRLEALGLLPKGGFVIACHGVPGVSYVIEAADDLGTWRPVSTNTMPDVGHFDHVDRSTGTRRFYRMVER